MKRKIHSLHVSGSKRKVNKVSDRVEGTNEEKGTEYHIPGTNYTGPGTHLQERLARGDEPTNYGDALARQHDIDYGKYLDPYWSTNKADYDMFWNFFMHPEKWNYDDYLTGYIGPGVIGMKHYLQKMMGYVEAEPEEKSAGLKRATIHSKNKSSKRMNGRRGRLRGRVHKKRKGLRFRRRKPGRNGTKQRRRIGGRRRGKSSGGRRKIFKGKNRTSIFKKIMGVMNPIKKYNLFYVQNITGCQSTGGEVNCTRLTFQPLTTTTWRNAGPNSPLLLADCLYYSGVDTAAYAVGGITNTNMLNREYYYNWRAKYTINNDINASVFVTVWCVISKQDNAQSVISTMTDAEVLKNAVLTNSATTIATRGLYQVAAATYLGDAELQGMGHPTYYNPFTDPVCKKLMMPYYTWKKKTSFILHPGKEKTLKCKGKRMSYFNRSHIFDKAGTILSHRKGEIDYVIQYRGEIAGSSTSDMFGLAMVNPHFSVRCTIETQIRKKADSANYTYNNPYSFGLISNAGASLEVHGMDVDSAPVS